MQSDGIMLLLSFRAHRMCHQSPGCEVTRALPSTLLAEKNLESPSAVSRGRGRAMGSISLSAFPGEGWGCPGVPGCPDPVPTSSLAQQSYLGMQGWGVQPCPSQQWGRQARVASAPGASEEERKIVVGSSLPWRGSAKPMPAYGFGGSCQRSC